MSSLPTVLRRTLKALGAAGLVLGCGAGAPIDRNAWTADYEGFKAQLEQVYANLAWFGSDQSPVDLPGLDRRTLAALAAAQTEEDGLAALTAFAAAFPDGHFSRRPAAGPALPESPTPKPVVLTGAEDAATGCAVLGYGATARTPFSSAFESLPGFVLIADGAAQAFRTALIAVEGRRIGLLRIESFEVQPYLSLCLDAWSDPRLRHDGHLDVDALNANISKAWYRTLAERLVELKSRGAEAVVVDVGANGGGDDSGDIAARLFTNRVLTSAPLYISRSVETLAYVDEQRAVLEEVGADPAAVEARPVLSATLARLDDVQAHAADQTCDMSWVWRERRAWDPGSPCSRLVRIGSAGGVFDRPPPFTVSAEAARRLHWPMSIRPLWGTWTGPLFVLTDTRTFSSAEMFAAVLQNNQAARVVGQRTGGDGCGWMGPETATRLTRAGLSFRTPTCVRLRGDGSDEVAGVSPDIVVVPAVGEGGRARALRLLHAIADTLP
jgi:hypothetical protein